MKSLKPPYDLLERDYFVVTHDNDVDEYTLHLRDGSSFDLGSAHDALIYFRLCNAEALGERCLDCSSNFRAVQAIPSKNRVFAIDIELGEDSDKIIDSLAEASSVNTQPILGIF